MDHPGKGCGCIFGCREFASCRISNGNFCVFLCQEHGLEMESKRLLIAKVPERVSPNFSKFQVALPEGGVCVVTTPKGTEPGSPLAICIPKKPMKNIKVSPSRGISCDCDECAFIGGYCSAVEKLMSKRKQSVDNNCSSADESDVVDDLDLSQMSSLSGTFMPEPENNFMHILDSNTCYLPTISFDGQLLLPGPSGSPGTEAFFNGNEFIWTKDMDTLLLTALRYQSSNSTVNWGAVSTFVGACEAECKRRFKEFEGIKELSKQGSRIAKGKEKVGNEVLEKSETEKSKEERVLTVNSLLKNTSVESNRSESTKSKKRKRNVTQQQQNQKQKENGRRLSSRKRRKRNCQKQENQNKKQKLDEIVGKTIYYLVDEKADVWEPCKVISELKWTGWFRGIFQPKGRSKSIEITFENYKTRWRY